jgi:mannose-6-phosphate isomerase-like protein (cupin superfamily)
MSEDGATPAVVDLARLLADTGASDGPLWTLASEDLNVNLLRFADGRGVPEHVNDEVDVLLVGVAGEGAIEVDGRALLLRAGQVCLVPKGSRRAIASVGGPFAYLSCHRRRGLLWPQ